MLIEASDARTYAAARALIEEYAAELAVDLCFQEFTAELAGLAEAYGPPHGCLLLAVDGESPAGTFAGCGGIRPLAPGSCEMKRMYVRPQSRGRHIGRQIALGLMEKARSLGYRHIFLDTLGSLTAAGALYRSLGFVETAAYYDNPIPGAIYMRRDL